MCWGKKPPKPSDSEAGDCPPGTVTEQCPLLCPNMEIEIDNTSTIDDDWVVRCPHTPRHSVSGRIRAVGSAANDATVVLVNPDGRLRFPNDTDTTRTLTVPRNGSLVTFEISGQTASSATGDAVIEAHCQTATGPVKARKGVTVVAVELQGLDDPNGNVLEIPEVNNLSLLPIVDHVAHRTIRLRFTPIALTANKTVEWSFAHSGIQGGVLTAGIQRGVLPAAPHNAHLETAAGFNFVPATRRSIIDANGVAAVRINLPPVAWNRGRLGVQFVDRPGCLREVDFEVPAIVVIDAGHGGAVNIGGSDANHAVSPTGVLEKDMTLDFARLVRDVLNASPRNIEVFMTRDADVNLSLAARANVGRDNAADVLVAIHMNGFDGVAHGTTIFVRPNGNNQVNHAEDVALATRIVNAVLVVNPISNRAQNLNDMVLGVLADTSLGNTAAHHKTRACLLEVDFIDVPRVDVTLNTGPDAAANRQAISNAIAEAIIEDILNQP